MRADVVLVQAWIPVSGDVVQTDLDIEDEKELGMVSLVGVQVGRTYRVVLVKTLPWNS
jgi:hypothetical protein